MREIIAIALFLAFFGLRLAYGSNISTEQDNFVSELVLFVEAEKDINPCPVPTSLIVATAVLESGFGESHHAKNSNNLFGIYTGKKSESLMRKPGVNGLYIKYFNSKEENIRFFMYDIMYKNFFVHIQPTTSKRRLTESLSQFLVRYSGQEDYPGKIYTVIRILKLKRYDA